MKKPNFDSKKPNFDSKKPNFDSKKLNSGLKKLNLNINNINPEGLFFKQMIRKRDPYTKQLDEIKEKQISNNNENQIQYNIPPNQPQRKQILNNVKRQILYKKQLNELKEKQILKDWDNFLKLKNVEPIIRKEMIEMYLHQMDQEGENVFTAPSIAKAWLGGGLYGAVLSIGEKAFKFELYDKNERTNLEIFDEIKKQNFNQVRNYIGRNNQKEIDQINASKYMNTPEKITFSNDGKVMISQYEKAKCDFSKLSREQKKLESELDYNKWLNMQELIIGNYFTHAIKVLAKIHSRKEAHGDLHMGNILVSTRIGKHGKEKIAFKLHDRSYKSAFLWFGIFLRKERPIFNKHLLNVVNKDGEIKSEIGYINRHELYQDRVYIKYYMKYLQLVDLNLLAIDIDGYLRDTGLYPGMDSHNKVFQILEDCWYVLNNSENAVQVLGSEIVEDLRKKLNKINNDPNININDILR